MTSETAQEEPAAGEAEELRELLVRLLVEAGPSQARLEQLFAAIEQGARTSELAGLEAQVTSLRHSIEHAIERTGSSGPPLQELLARSDAQLAAQLSAAEQRAQAQLAQLSEKVSTLTERVSLLEAQLRKLSAAASP